MIWTDKKFLFIDCQTTATHPSQGQLLEIAWCWASVDEFHTGEIETHLIKLNEGSTIPQRVREMTRITDEEMENANDIRDVLDTLKLQIAEEGATHAVAHYAVFEKTFLEAAWKELYPEEIFPLAFLCTQKISKCLFPRMTSYNLRAVSGFLGSSLHLNNRADSHVEATMQVWLGVVRELQNREITTMEGLDEILSVKKPKAQKKEKARFEYRMPREKRLSFPDEPGVYKMFSKEGTILYIGKATSLHSRVNSYFRGGTSKDRRKQELMAQVWDIEVTPCRSPLEAALVESDEIKKWLPRYNVALRESRRPIVFFSRDFSSASERSDRDHCIGPFKNRERLDQMLEFFECLQMGVLGQPFWDFVEPELINDGWSVFLNRHAVSANTLSSVRNMLAFGMRLWRKQIREDEATLEEATEFGDNDTSEENQDESEIALTIDDVADKFERMFVGAAYNVYRAKKIHRLMWAKVKVTHKGGDPHYLCFSDGKLIAEELWAKGDAAAFEKVRVDSATYDRLSILLSGIQSAQQDVSVDFE